jgi:hypothetical protein
MSIFSLPSELLRIIIDDVDPKSLLKLQLTCRDFRAEIAPKLWSHICIDTASSWLVQSQPYVASDDSLCADHEMMVLHTCERVYIKLNIHNLRVFFKAALFGHLDPIVPYVRTITLINGDGIHIGAHNPNITRLNYDRSILEADPCDLLHWITGTFMGKRMTEIRTVEVWNWPSKVTRLPDSWWFISQFPPTTDVKLRLMYEWGGVDGYFTNPPCSKVWYDKLLSTNIKSITINSGALNIWLKNDIYLPTTTVSFNLVNEFGNLQTKDLKRFVSKCSELESLKIGCKEINFSHGAGDFWPSSVTNLALDCSNVYGTGERFVAANILSLSVSREGVPDAIAFPNLESLYVEIFVDIWQQRRFAKFESDPDPERTAKQIERIPAIDTIDFLETNDDDGGTFPQPVVVDGSDSSALGYDKGWNETLIGELDPRVKQIAKTPLPAHSMYNLRHLSCKESEFCRIDQLLTALNLCRESLETLYLMIDPSLDPSNYDTNLDLPKLETVMVHLYKQTPVLPLLRKLVAGSPNISGVYVSSGRGLDGAEEGYFHIRGKPVIDALRKFDGSAFTFNDLGHGEYIYELDLLRARREFARST